MTTKAEQLDLFVSLIGDVPLRDDKEMMRAPMVAISKRAPNRIEWASADGTAWVSIVGDPEAGIATIWDFDVLIWAMSQLNAAVERGAPTSVDLSFVPSDVMRAIRWTDRSGRVGGKEYARFKAAIDRLAGTRVRTNMREDGRHTRRDIFSLIESVGTTERTADGVPVRMSFRLPSWIYRAVTESRSEVLAITPLYFDLAAGIDRFLYRLARRHAGNGVDNRNGWAFSFRDLYARSGSGQTFKGFSRSIRQAIERNRIPEYIAVEERGANGDPILRLRHRREGEARD